MISMQTDTSDSSISQLYLSLLKKCKHYLNIIRAYDTRHDAVRGKLNWAQLKRMKLYVPSQEGFNSFISLQTQVQDLRERANKYESDLIKEYFEKKEWTNGQ